VWEGKMSPKIGEEVFLTKLEIELLMVLARINPKIKEKEVLKILDSLITKLRKSK
jgi:hypothetical protein